MYPVGEKKILKGGSKARWGRLLSYWGHQKWCLITLFLSMSLNSVFSLRSIPCKTKNMGPNYTHLMLFTYFPSSSFLPACKTSERKCYFYNRRESETGYGSCKALGPWVKKCLSQCYFQQMPLGRHFTSPFLSSGQAVSARQAVFSLLSSFRSSRAPESTGLPLS